MEKKEIAELYLAKLRIRFETKIESDEYYLSYSGGKDSHLIYWYLKEILKNTEVPIVGVNTRMEHKEIKNRILKNCDKVLYPKLKPFDIKEQYGIPCFTKWQDGQIDRYQRGSRCKSVMESVTGENRISFKLNKTAKRLLLNGELHRVSPNCCKYTKKVPMEEYGVQTGRKPITGVRGAESATRKKGYKSCLSKNGMFTPLYDFPDWAVDAIYEVYNIETPDVYELLDRTGGAGCPYGNHGGNTETELTIVTPAQKSFLIELFRESYDVLGIDYAQERLDV